MGKNWVITKKSKHRGKKLGTTIPTQYSVRITLQSHQLRQFTPFYRQTLISATYCRLHTLRYIEYAYWRQLRPDVFSNESNRCDDGCWSQDIYSNEPQPFDEFWLTWSWWWPCGWWSERGQLLKRWEWRKCRRWRWWWRWQWWRKSGKWWWIEGWNRWLRWGWDVEDGKQHEQGSYGEIFGFCVGGGAGGHQD